MQPERITDLALEAVGLLDERAATVSVRIVSAGRSSMTPTSTIPIMMNEHVLG
jgi:hypothetical protein